MCLFCGSATGKDRTEQTKPDLKDDGEEARKEDYEEQLVTKLRPRLEVDSPITPNDG